MDVLRPARGSGCGVSHAYVTKRIGATGRRSWVVRYRWGGRGFKLIHLGSKATEREAKLLRDWAAGELIAGRDPRASLAESRSAAMAPKRVTDVDEAWSNFIDARLDTAEGTRRNYRKAKDAFSDRLGSRDVRALRVADIQAAVSAMSVSLSPATLHKYVNTLRQVLDFAEVEPNVARDRHVKLPSLVRDEPDPPDAAETMAMLSQLTHRWRLALVTTEQTGCVSGRSPRSSGGTST